MLPLPYAFYLVLALGIIVIPLGLFVSLLCLYGIYKVIFLRRPVICRSWNGYTIFGISNPAFKDSFTSVLGTLGYQWEEQESGFHFPEQGVVLKVMDSPKGIVMIGAEKKDRARVKEMMDALRTYYASASVTITPHYTIIGTVMMVLGTVFVIAALSTMMVSEKKLSRDVSAYARQECLKQMYGLADKKGIDAHALIATNEALLQKCQHRMEDVIHQYEKTHAH